MASLLHLFLSLITLADHRNYILQTNEIASGENNEIASGENNEIASGEVHSCQLYIQGNGSVKCIEDVRRSVCDIECDGKYEGVFVCYPDKGWSSKLPYCAREVTKGEVHSCQLSIEGNGSVNCPNDTFGCDIECDGKYEGVFVCYPDKGWYPKLPYCAREVTEDEVHSCQLSIEGNGSVNCPNDTVFCDIECDGKYEGVFFCLPDKGWFPTLPYCAREVTEELRSEGKFGCPEHVVEKCIEFCREILKTTGNCIAGRTGQKMLCACG